MWRGLAGAEARLGKAWLGRAGATPINRRTKGRTVADQEDEVRYVPDWDLRVMIRVRDGAQARIDQIMAEMAE